MGKKCNFLFVIVMCLYVLGCTRHEINVAPVEIKPIHITIDINLKIDRALDDYFSDLDRAASEIEAEKTLEKKSNNAEKDGAVEQ